MPAPTAPLPLPPPPQAPLPPIPTSQDFHKQPSPRHARTISSGSYRSAHSQGLALPPPPSTQTPEQLLQVIRDRARDHQLLRACPSVPLLSHSAAAFVSRARSDSTRSAPAGACIAIVSGNLKGANHSAATAAARNSTRYGKVPTAIACLPGPMFGAGEADSNRPRWEAAMDGRGAGGLGRRKGAAASPSPSTGAAHVGLVGEMRHKVKQLMKGLRNVSVSISFREKDEVDDFEVPRQTRKEMTLRIKNSKTGNCVFEMYVFLRQAAG